ncbi:MAG: CinA family protein [Spirochaetales bacterium]
MNSPTYALAESLGTKLRTRGWLLATAESCTGGGLAHALTEVPGSSDWFDRGFVTYSNESKTQMLGVSADLVTQFGAVSGEVAAAMAQQACHLAGTQVSVATTGIAGPGGGSADKPVGTVWFGWSVAGRVATECCHFAGDRAAVRSAAVLWALQKLDSLL